MNRLFLRLYASLAAAIGAAILLTATVDRLGLQEDRIDPAVWTEAEAAVRDQFARFPPHEAERNVIDHYRVRVRLLPDDTPAERPPRATDWLMPPPTHHEVRLDDGRRVAISWERPPPRLGAPVVALAALLAASGALVWWLRGLDAGLQDLTRVAERFGAQDLSVRAAEDPRKPTRALAGAFNRMADRIDSLLRAQEDLLAGVSHELRTPLMRLQFAVEMLPSVQGEAAQERHVADIQKDIGELDALIGELLAFARLRGGETVEWADLSSDALWDGIADEVRRLAPDRAVIVEPGSVRLRGDRRLLLRALRNLAHNAVRHGRGTITLGAHTGADGLSLVVSDEGPGIPAGDRQRVLEPFVRLDPSRTDGGLGLGLALVDRIAKLHHGRVEIGVSPGGGARIALVLTPADAG